jgi:Cd2+/Zn2+-exporting ATPase
VDCTCGCGCSACRDEQAFSLKKPLLFILPAAFLTVTGLVFQEALQNTPGGLGEYLVFLAAYLLCGWKILYNTLRNFARARFFDENALMSIATIGAIAIHELPEAAGVMLFFKVGELFQELSVSRSRRSIRALLNTRPDYARLRRDNQLQVVKPEIVAIGEEIVVQPGEKIPLDGEIISGQTTVDTSPLTGESLPRSLRTGEQVLAGTLNLSGLISVRVTRPFSESSVSKIMELVQNASARKAPAEKFITTFARYYTPAVVAAAVFTAVIPPLFFSALSFSTWFYRALVLLVISCPCALVISIPLAYFGGIGGASRRGILVKGASHLDTLTRVKTVIFDKTGTLTGAALRVTDVVALDGYSEESLLRLAATVESHSRHPIATSIRQAYPTTLDTSEISDYTEIPGCGVQARVDKHLVALGNDRLLKQYGITIQKAEKAGTLVHLLVDKLYVGYLVLADEPKDEAAEAVRALKRAGVERVVMLTGDRFAAADFIAARVGVDSFRAELLPEDKVRELKTERTALASGGKIAFVGDGINDAPALAQADVGVAMGALGSEAAIETADVVIMQDNPLKMVEAITLARKTRRLVWQNILLALGVKGIFIVLGAIGIAAMWEAIIADVGVALMCVLNSARAIR